MKLLVVTQYFYPENFRINELVSEFVRRGHEITVLTGYPNYPSGRFQAGYRPTRVSEESALGAKVIRVPMLARGTGGGLRLILNYLSFALSASIAAGTRLQGPFDAVFVFEVSPVTVGLPAIAASRRFKAPILFWVLDLWPETLRATGVLRSERLLATTRKVVDWIYRQCQCVLVQSRAFIPSVAQSGVAAERIRYFPNWTEGDYEASASIPVQQEQRKDELRIVYAGNIGVAQDFPTILDCAQQLEKHGRSVQWLIAGDGRQAGWVRDQILVRGLGQRIILLGQLPASHMPQLFASADALLVALRDDPVFALTVPGKLQSYLTSGKPVLAMLNGEGARLVREAGAGIAVNAGDADGLATAILELAGMLPDERRQMGARGQALALQEFQRDKLFDRLEGWLMEAAAARASSRKDNYDK